MILAHGSRSKTWTPTYCPCFTDRIDAAMTYAGPSGWVHLYEVDVSGAVEVEGYDHDEDTAMGDDGELIADVVSYSDADETGRQHTTWRTRDGYPCRLVAVVSVSDADDTGVSTAVALAREIE